MRLITNIQPPFLSDILFEIVTKLKNIKAAVAYCENYKLFECCKRYKIKLDYYGRLDDSINLNLKKLQSFLTNDISIHIIGGSKFHPKVIWCCNYGVYIGSANLTQSAWKTNIECGLWLTQKELEENHLIDSLEDFFKYIKQNSTSLSRISSSIFQEVNKSKKKIQSNKEDLQILKKLGIFIFTGSSNKQSLHKKDKNGQVDQQRSTEGTYRDGSGWSNKTEMMCLLILKKLKREEFPRGRLSKLCEGMSLMKGVDLTPGTIKQKVHNYEFLDTNGKKGLKNASKNTKYIYKEYKDTSVEELERIIKNYSH